MSVSLRHALSQGPVLRALLSTAGATLRKKPGGALPTPTPLLRATLPPRGKKLVQDYLRWTGGKPASYRGVLPTHLYPQWGFPLLAQTLIGIPYDLKRVLNGGTRIEINGLLPADEPLKLEACLASIDDNGRRAVLEQRLVTSTPSSTEALVATVYVIVPLTRPDAAGPKAPKERPRVPEGARPILRRRLAQNAGWEFALLTGDFNPVHWLRPYAKAAGFGSTILHGYATLAIALEALIGVVFAGDPTPLTSVDVKFVRPLLLPHDVAVFVDGNALFVGENPGGPAFMTGVFTHG